MPGLLWDVQPLSFYPVTTLNFWISPRRRSSPCHTLTSASSTREDSHSPSVFLRPIPSIDVRQLQPFPGSIFTAFFVESKRRHGRAVVCHAKTLILPVTKYSARKHRGRDWISQMLPPIFFQLFFHTPPSVCLSRDGTQSLMFTVSPAQTVLKEK